MRRGAGAAGSRRWGAPACSRRVCSAVLHDQHLPGASIVWHRGLALLAASVWGQCFSAPKGWILCIHRNTYTYKNTQTHRHTGTQAHRHRHADTQPHTGTATDKGPDMTQTQTHHKTDTDTIYRHRQTHTIHTHHTHTHTHTYTHEALSY